MVNNLSVNAGDLRDVGSTLEWGRSPEGGHGNPLQYSCLENPRDREAWRIQSKGGKESDMTERLSLHYGVIYKNSRCTVKMFLII